MQFNSAAFYEGTLKKNVTSDNPEMTQLVRRIEEWCTVTDGIRVLDLGCFVADRLFRDSSRCMGIDTASTKL